MVKKKILNVFGWSGVLVFWVLVFWVFLGFTGWYAFQTHHFKQQSRLAHLEVEELYHETVKMALLRDIEGMEALFLKSDQLLWESGNFLDLESKENLQWMKAQFKKILETLNAQKSLDVRNIDLKSDDYVNTAFLKDVVDKLKKSIDLNKELVLILESILMKSKKSYPYHSELLQKMKVLMDQNEIVIISLIEMYQFFLDKQGDFILKNGQLIRYYEKDITQLQKIIQALERQGEQLRKQTQEFINENKDREKQREQRMENRLNIL